jgi:hypothetical protein
LELIGLFDDKQFSRLVKLIVIECIQTCNTVFNKLSPILKFKFLQIFIAVEDDSNDAKEYSENERTAKRVLDNQILSRFHVEIVEVQETDATVRQINKLNVANDLREIFCLDKHIRINSPPHKLWAHKNCFIIVKVSCSKW